MDSLNSNPPHSKRSKLNGSSPYLGAGFDLPFATPSTPQSTSIATTSSPIAKIIAKREEREQGKWTEKIDHATMGRTRQPNLSHILPSPLSSLPLSPSSTQVSNCNVERDELDESLKTIESNQILIQQLEEEVKLLKLARSQYQAQLKDKDHLLQTCREENEILARKSNHAEMQMEQMVCIHKMDLQNRDLTIISLQDCISKFQAQISNPLEIDIKSSTEKRLQYNSHITPNVTTKEDKTTLDGENKELIQNQPLLESNSASLLSHIPYAQLEMPQLLTYCSQLESKVASMRIESETSKLAVDHDRTALNDLLKRRENECSTIQLELSHSQHTIFSLESELSETRSRLLAIENASANVAQLEACHNEQQIQTTHLQQQVQEFGRLFDQFQQELNHRDELESMCADLSSELNVWKSKYEHVEILQEQLNQAQEAYRRLEEKTHDYMTIKLQLEKLNEERTTWLSIVDELEQLRCPSSLSLSPSSSTTEANYELDQSTDSRSNMRQLLEQLVAEKNRLSMCLEVNQSELVRLQTHNQQLEQHSNNIESMLRQLKVKNKNDQMILTQQSFKLKLVQCEHEGLKKLLETYQLEQQMLISKIKLEESHSADKENEEEISIKLEKASHDEANPPCSSSESRPSLAKLYQMLTKSDIHLKEMENQLTLKTNYINELEVNLKEIQDQISSSDRENHRLNASCQALEQSLGRGEYNTNKFKVLHLATTPWIIKEKQAHQSEIETLKHDNQALSEKLAILQDGQSNALTVASSDWLKIKNEVEQLRHKDEENRVSKERLLQVVRSKIDLFKNAVYHIFGWTIELEDPTGHLIKMRSMYYPNSKSSTKGTTDDFLAFHCRRNQMVMLETPFCANLDANLMKWLEKKNALAAVMAKVTLMLYEKQYGKQVW